MIYETKTIQLKNGQQAIFRSPNVDDASAMINYLKTCTSETDFLLRTVEECNESEDSEKVFLENMIRSDNNCMIVCEIDGEIAGNCQLSFKTKQKNKHRASIGIALIQKFWSLGIGTAMFKELICLAEEKGILQLELEVIEGNTRAMYLYEKMGFKIVAEHPCAIKTKDGRFASEFLMVKQLNHFNE